jgi:hypothetical protein
MRTIDHEILGCARAMEKQITPPFTLRHDHAAASDSHDFDLMHIVGEGDLLRQADGPAVAGCEH